MYCGRVREYGESGKLVIAIHGGPGAPGSIAPVARELADTFCVLEPFQRPSGSVPLTVAGHIADLRDLIVARGESTPPVIAGHSWGAMLALAFAAAYPGLAGRLVLISCGTFDKRARARFQAAREENPLYHHDPIRDDGPVEFDEKAQRETWSDMLRLQDEGVYPAAFTAIRCPVVMLHGAQDPHPGRMIYEGLRAFLPQIEYREFDRCGHYPWQERAARDEFFAALRGCLT